MLAQTLTLFDVDASSWPKMKAKFFAISQNGTLQRPVLAELGMTENGTGRIITRVNCPAFSKPRDISAVLVVDISGSMSRLRGGVRNLDIAKIAAGAFVESLPDVGSECAVTSFDNFNYLDQDFTSDKVQLVAAINALKAASGTNYNAALIDPAAGGLLVSAAGKNEKVIIMLTDGQAAVPSVGTIIATAKQQKCAIYVVTLGMSCPQSLRDIATQTGGNYFEDVTTAEDAKRVYQTIMQISQGSEPCVVEWESIVSCQSSQTIATLEWQAVTSSAEYIPPTGSGPGVVVIPQSIKMGVVAPGVTKDTSIVIKAYLTDFVISNISLKSGSTAFSIVGVTYPIILAADSSKRITVRYKPTDSTTNYTVFEIQAGSCPSFFSMQGGFPGKSSTARTLKVVHPNGGELFAVGSDTVITWQGIAPADRVALEYSIDAGKSWILLTDSATGLTYDWKNIPLPASVSCLVRAQQWSESGPIEQAPKITWQRNLGGTDYEEARSIIQTYDGGYLMAGHTASGDGDVGLKRGNRDCWVVKLDVLGNIQWKNIYGGALTDEVSSIQQTLDGGYIFTGSTNSVDGDVTLNKGAQDVWVVKLNSIGNIVWQKTYGGTASEFGNSIQQTSDGGYIVAGQTSSENGDVTLNKGLSDVWVLKLDQSGDILWQKTYGGSGSEGAQSIQQTNDGGYAFAGFTESNDGDVTNAKGNLDYWVVKINGSGIIEWQKALGGTGVEAAREIQQTKDDGYIVAGSTTSNNGDVTNNKGAQDFWLVKLNSVGDVLWQRVLGGPGVDLAYSVQQTADEQYLVVGSTSSTSGNITENKGIADVWIAKVTVDGNLEWQKTYGGSEADVAYCIKQTTDVGYILAGYTGSSNGDITQRKGGGDCWVVKLSPEGKPFQQDTSDAWFEIVAPKATATEIDMRQCFVGSSKDSTIAPFIRNAGVVKFRVDSMYFTGPDAGAFALLSGIPKYVVRVSGTNLVELTFTPARVGLHNAQIVIITQSDTLRQNVLGTGVQPVLEVVNKLIDFGKVVVGRQKDSVQVVTLKNVSRTDIRITKVTHDGPNTTDFITVAGAPSYLLAAGEELKLNLRYSARELGRTSGQILFTYQGLGSPARVQLFGEGVRGTIALVDSIVDFGKHKVGTQKDSLMVATIKNIGNVPVDIQTVDISGGGLPEFTIQNGSGAPITLMPDSVMLVDLRFSPNKIGLAVADLLFHYDGVGSPARVLLHGEGTGEQIQIANAVINFGSHKLGTFKDSIQAQTLKNIGTASVDISQIRITGADASAFTIQNGSGNNVSIAPGESIRIDLRFTPEKTGLAVADLIYEFVGGGSPAQVRLTGSGTSEKIVVLDTLIDFGTHSVGVRTDSLFVETIRNVGTLPVQITSVTISGVNASDFSILNGTDGPFLLTANNSGYVDVSYTPSVIGMSVAELVYTHSGVGSPARVMLLGSGVEGSIAVVNNEIDFGTHVIGTLADTVAARTIRNISQVPVNVSGIRIVGIDALDFSIQNGTGVGVLLMPGDEIPMDLQYIPVRTGVSLADIFFDHDGAGSPAKVQLIGTGKPPAVTPGIEISVGTHSAYAGREIVIPVHLRGTTTKLPPGETRISVQFAFNPTLLYPLDLPMTKIDDQTAIITINDIYTGTLPSTQIGGLRFESGLGNATSSPLTLLNPTNTLPVTITLVDGEFKTLGICNDGGARLLNPGALPGITAVFPNPASGNPTISFEIVERGFTELYLVDASGKRVQNLYIGIPSDFGLMTLTLNTTALGSGQYFVVLKTPTSVTSSEIQISR